MSGSANSNETQGNRLVGLMARGASAPATPTGADATRATAPGSWCEVGGTSTRRHMHSDADAWAACVGVPYRGEAAFAPADLLDPPGTSPERLLGTLGGEFALALHDPRTQRLVLATDRFASIPLYYAQTDGGLAFGTDLEWVAGRAAHQGVDPQALYDYLFFSVVPGSRTIRRGVSKLPAASTLEFDGGRTQVRRYWTPEFERKYKQDASALRSRTFDAISRAVGHTVAAGPGFGCFLSGGLDSSSVAGLAARHAGSPVHAFTIGFDVPEFDESRYAQITAAHFGLVLHEKRIRSQDVSDCMDAIVGAYPEPFGNASAVSTYLCARFAREHGMTRLLAGDGGDELFAGNERYQKQSVFELYGALPHLLRRAAVDPLAAASRALPGPARKLWSYVEQARVPLPDRLFAYNLLVRNRPGDVLTGEFLRSVDTQSPYDYARAIYGEPPGGDALDRMLYLDWALTLTDNDLPKVRFACELAGLPVHFPMLAPDVVQVSTLVASRDKLTLHSLRKFYKEAFAEFLPPAVTAKQKHGFGVPVGIWINEDPRLRERVHERLRSLAARDIVRADFIHDLQRRQQVEHATYYGTLTWWLFMLEEWLLAHGA